MPSPKRNEIPLTAARATSTVACPTCKVSQGKPCMRMAVHPSRIEAYQATLNAKPTSAFFPANPFSYAARPE